MQTPLSIETDNSQIVLEAITSRRSVRGFRDTPVPRSTVERIITAAARAPSATNTQPWRVHVLTGQSRARLVAAIMAERASGAPEPAPEYLYAASDLPDPYLTRRRAVGWQLYGLLGIAKGDRAGARAWHDQNFDFFGAPVGMIFTLDRRLGLGAYLDLGMFMQNIMVAARGFGLDTCAQAAFAGYHATIRSVLALPAEDMVMCGLALGWAKADAVANTLVSERAERIRQLHGLSTAPLSSWRFTGHFNLAAVGRLLLFGGTSNPPPAEGRVVTKARTLEDAPRQVRSRGTGH